MVTGVSTASFATSWAIPFTPEDWVAGTIVVPLENPTTVGGFKQPFVAAAVFTISSCS